MWKKLFNLKFWLPVLVLGIGAGATFVLLKNKPTARKKPNFQRGALVEVMEATLSNPRIEVRTHGRVRAAKKVVLSARIGGEVIWISPKMNEGSFFKKGDSLLSIGIRQSQSRLKAPFNGVVQSKNVDLGQYVNPGAQLATLLGSDQAEVVIDLPMGRMDWLPQNSATTNSGNQYQIPALISLAGMSSALVWPATVKRHLLELTPRGMMVQLIAEANDPFRLKRMAQVKAKKKKPSGTVQINKTEVANPENPVIPETSNMPLFVGAFVDVTIPGRQLKNVVTIPTQALRDRDTVWIALETFPKASVLEATETKDSAPKNISAQRNIELQVRRVQIAHLDQDNVFLSGGIKPGEKIIISPIKGAADGLKLRLAGVEKMDWKKMTGEKRWKRKRPEEMGKQRGKKQGQKSADTRKEES